MSQSEKQILEHLAEIKSLLLSKTKQVLTFEEFCNYAGISKSTGYKLTCTNQLPFYRPHGKLIYIERSDAENWLLQNRVKSVSEIKNELDTK